VRSPSRVFLIHSGVFLFFLFLLGLYPSNVVLEGAAYDAIDLFLIASFIMVGQCFLLFSRNDRASLFVLLLADGALIMSLVKVSGASSSPFLTLFPLLGLSGALLFQTSFAFALILACTLFIGFALNWGMTVIWNWTALFLVGALGIYLVKALRKSGQALEQSESARRRLENLQRAILTNIPSGLISIDTEQRVIQMNRVAQEILGVTESYSVLRQLTSLLPNLNVETSSEAPSSSRSRPVVEYVHPEGNRLSLGYTIAALTDVEKGHVLGKLIVFQDLTSVMQLEEDLRKSEKLAAVGKLAAGIAHEIRNPLAGITGSAQLLAGDPNLDKDDRRLLEIIQKEAARLDGLISDFLDYVRPPKLNLDRVNLRSIVEETLDALRNDPVIVKQSRSLKIEPAQGPAVRVDGDENKIKQVLINLVINAAQAGAKNITVNLMESGILRVIDDGAGVDKKVIGRLFEPFFTTKDRGTGLGLAMSYRLLEAMGAGIKVISPLEDDANGGTMFIIEFKGSPT
jgi:two-component system sensor histidine kinase PilS (NtrC family)